MANKYQLITELYRTTLLSVTETPQAWKAFLRSACNNYKSLAVCFYTGNGEKRKTKIGERF